MEAKMKHTLRRLLLLSLLVGTGSAGQAFAQGTTSRVTGTIVDQTGSALPGATVTLTNEATQVSFGTTTTSAGAYAFNSVQVGTYSVAVELASFKRFVSRANVVAINQPTTVNATLEV